MIHFRFITYAILSLLLLLFPFSEFVFFLSLMTICAFAICIFYNIVKDKTKLHLEVVSEIGIIIGYIVSTFIYSTLRFIQYGYIEFTENSFGLLYTQEDISYCLILIIISLVIISFIGKINNKSCYNEIKLNISKKSILCIILSCATIFYALINGDISYMGVSQFMENRISPFGALCFVALPPMTILSFIHTFLLPSEYKKYKLILILTSCTFIIALIPMGRRVLMYTFILSILLIGPQVFHSFKKIKFKFIYISIGLLLIVFINVWGFRTFYAMRIAINQEKYDEKPSISTIIPHTYHLLASAYTHAEVQEKLMDNISTRPFILSYLAALFAAHQHKSTPMLGELRHAFAMSIPSLLNPLKTTQFPGSAEEFSHPSLGIAVFDGPNTIFTAGLNDLGYLGMILYPIILVTFYTLIIRFLPKKWPKFIKIFIMIRLNYSLIYFEDSLGSMIGSGLRDTLIVALLFLIFFNIDFNKKAKIYG